MFYIPFNYYTISLLIGAFTALISGFVVMTHDPKRSENQAWFALTMCTAIWSLGYFFMTVSKSHDYGFFWNWVLHYAAIFIPLFYYLLVLIITENVKKQQYKFAIYTVIAFIFTTINLSPEFVKDVVPKVSFNFAPVPGPLYILFFVYFFILVIDGLLTTFFAAKKAEKKSVRARYYYTILFTLAASLGGGSVFATTFLTVIPPYPLLLFSLYPAISGYAILKYQLFDVKVITAQVFTFALWIFIFIRVLLSETFQEQIINISLLAVTIILGLFLNKSVKNEVEQRERIELLAADLQKANDRLTFLNKEKTEFVSFATHQLRAPMTAMKGYASLLLEGDMGVLPEMAKQGVQRIFDSTNTLVNIVDDYLNLTRLELGTMKYLFDVIDLKKLISDVVAELQPSISKAPIAFSFSAQDIGHEYLISADKDKLKQIFSNIIDNSIKYTPKGTVEATLSYDQNLHKYSVVVKDTGIGIAPEVLPKLFQKFTRATNANKTNIKGTGLGLFIAKQMIEAHHGSIRAESAGEGKGSTFIMNLEPYSKA